MLDAPIIAWLRAAAEQPIIQGLAIVLGTFVLEDAATVVAATEAQAGTVPLPVALCSLYLGIVLGDIGLYGLGALSARVHWARRWIPPERTRQGREWLSGRVFRIVLVSRFLPGTRLPVYTACGFLGADIKQFALAAVAATLAWTSLLFAASLAVGQFLLDHLGIWRWVGVIGLAIAVIAIGQAVARRRTFKGPNA